MKNNLFSTDDLNGFLSLAFHGIERYCFVYPQTDLFTDVLMVMSSLQTSTRTNLEHGQVKKKNKTKHISPVEKVVLKPDCSVGITSHFKYRCNQ